MNEVSNKTGRKLTDVALLVGFLKADTLSGGDLALKPVAKREWILKNADRFVTKSQAAKAYNDKLQIYLEAGIANIVVQGCTTNLKREMQQPPTDNESKIVCKGAAQSKTKTSFTLLSKISVQVQDRLCDECGKTKPRLEKYHSDQGIVYVCRDCKTDVLDRSFPKSDFIAKCFRGGRVSPR